MRLKIRGLMMLCYIIAFLVLVSCSPQGTPSDNSSATNLNKSSKTVLSEILTEKELADIESKIQAVSFASLLDHSDIRYQGNSDSINRLSEIGIKGIPVLMLESISEEREDAFSKQNNEDIAVGIERSWFITYTVIAVCRVGFYDLPEPNDAMIPSKHYYVRWQHAKTELPEILASDRSLDEKLTAYREFGMFSVPYIKKEIEKGNTQFEKFFPLIGAHLTTAEYMGIVEVADSETLVPTQEEIDAILLSDNENFDYKLWLSENEEDLNNLFKFLDAYCAEYEAEQNSK